MGAAITLKPAEIPYAEAQKIYAEAAKRYKLDRHQIAIDGSAILAPRCHHRTWSMKARVLAARSLRKLRACWPPRRTSWRRTAPG